MRHIDFTAESAEIRDEFQFYGPLSVIKSYLMLMVIRFDIYSMLISFIKSSGLGIDSHCQELYITRYMPKNPECFQRYYNLKTRKQA